MAFDFSKVSGETFGDINDVFFKKDGKSIIPQSGGHQQNVSVADIAKGIQAQADQAKTFNGGVPGQTVINISKDVIGGEEDLQIQLTILEEKRRNTTSVRNKNFIDLNTGEEITILDQTEMYNGTNLFTAKHLDTQKTITYPRGMFVGREKQFVPKEFYIREAERSIEDTIDKYGMEIMKMIQNPDIMAETSDGKYLEVVLEKPLDIIGGMVVPDRVQIPVKRMFDMDYKLLMLENVICLDNKIAGLLFIDIWF